MRDRNRLRRHRTPVFSAQRRLLTLLAVAVGASASAQMIMDVVPPAWIGPTTLSPIPIAGAGDIDGDGVMDLLVGAPNDNTAGASAGAVRVVSGRDGSLMLTVYGAAGDRLGSRVAAAGDVNGDGVPDLLSSGSSSSLPGAGRVWVLSGADGSPIHILDGVPGEGFGAALAGVRDVSGDGVPDLLVGAPNSDLNGTDSGRSVLVSGATGETFLEVAGSAAHARHGSSVTGLGDFDGDGVPDHVVAEAGKSGVVASSLRILSGADGSPLATIPFWGSVHRTGDHDGDGLPDLLVVQQPVYAQVVSSASGDVLHYLGWELHGHVQAAASVGDLDGDGVPEIAVTARPSHGEGTLRVYSGTTGAPLLTFSSNTLPQTFGGSLAALGNATGDGLPDLAVGATNTGVPGTSGVYVLSLAPSPWTFAWPGAIWPPSPQISVSGTLQPGSPLQWLLWSAVPAAPAWLVLGTSQLGMPFKGGTLQPSPDLVLFVGTDAAGKAKLQAVLPHDAPSGLELWCQWWIADAAAAKGFAGTSTQWGSVP